MQKTMRMTLIKRKGKIYTRIRISKVVGFPQRTIFEMLCKKNPEKNKLIKSSTMYDYYEFEGNFLGGFKEGFTTIRELAEQGDPDVTTNVNTTD